MRAIIGLGSNQGKPELNVLEAARALERLPHLVPVALSSGYLTEPLGPPQPTFLNAAALVETTLTPRELMATLLGLEAALGRQRLGRLGPRLIDLDLLLIEDLVEESELLILPHPRLTERAFALVPLLELAPEATDPRSGVPLRAALEAIGLAGIGEPRPLPARVTRRAIDHTADLGFTLSGRSLPQALEGAATALVDLMVDRRRVVERERHVVEAEGDELVDLLVALLGELVFLVDAHRFVPRRVVLLHHQGTKASLAVYGEPLREDAQLLTQVKAVTYHGATLEQAPRGGRWTARVIVDV